MAPNWFDIGSMPRVGSDAKLTGWCPKTRSAPMITQQPRITDPLMAQCWPSFYDAGTTLTHQWLNASCLLGFNSPTGTVKADFFTIILFHRISLFI